MKLWKPVFIPPYDPRTLFQPADTGAWLDINGQNLRYTTAAGATPAIAVNDAVGRAVAKSGTNALNATDAQRPLLKALPNGRLNLYHDRVDDKLTLANMPAGTYTVGFATFAGVQIYNILHSALGTLSIPGVDYTEALIINRVLTTAETAQLRTHLERSAQPVGATDVFRFYCSSNSVNLSMAETSPGAAGITWELGDGQTASGASCVKTIVAPQSVIMRAVDPSKITGIDWTSKSLFGQLAADLTMLGTGVSGVFRVPSNALTGAMPMLPVSIGAMQVRNNKLSGPLDFSRYTALAEFIGDTNSFSYFVGTVPATLGYCDARSYGWDAANVNAMLAAFVAAGRASGQRVLNLSGTNAAPTGQGLIDKATLTSRGWVVTTN